jgi:hypothetical protein
MQEKEPTGWLELWRWTGLEPKRRIRLLCIVMAFTVMLGLFITAIGLVVWSSW